MLGRKRGIRHLFLFRVLQRKRTVYHYTQSSSTYPAPPLSRGTATMTSNCVLPSANTSSLGPLPANLTNGTALSYCAANGLEPDMVACCAPNPVNPYPQYGPCASWCEIPKGKFKMLEGQDVLSAGDSEELDQLFSGCLINATGPYKTGTTICEVPSAASKLKFDGGNFLWWMVLGTVAAHVAAWL